MSSGPTRRAGGSAPSFLVEHYRPGITADAFRAAVAQVRASAAAMRRDGSPVRCVHSTLVPEDEAMLSVVDAASSDLVEQLFARAGVRVDRIVTALAHRGRNDGPDRQIRDEDRGAGGVASRTRRTGTAGGRAQMQIGRQANIWLLAALTTISLSSRATAASTPAKTCQAAQNIAAGKYGACRQTAEAKYATSLDGAKRDADLVKCQTKLQRAWAASEAKAAAKGGVCPSAGDLSSVQSAVDLYSGVLATSLGGSGSPVLPQARPLKTGADKCYSSSGNAIPCPGTGQDAEFQSGVARSYRVIGFTVRDDSTGLEWEKLADDGSISDVDNVYSFVGALAKIATLNSSLYGGHGDWRLPNRFELETLLDHSTSNPAVSSQLRQCFAGCTQLICSCTAAGDYWTSTLYEALPVAAVTVDFQIGFVRSDFANNASVMHHVRAVRGGP
jgi:hypothetical protein